ncbi:phenylalanine--tRNA ligase beta subunit-like isoform X2 [Ornithodoros turicata]|uniref:phenylalanine--tRNA ligase beta subunit-like isoform X2 n=1 Tax=Ornithodoros turicata TaxID=34597 RepID=UPI003138F887
MPTVGVKADLINEALGKVFSEEEFADLCFEYGLELDEVTTEKQMVSKERGEEKSDGASEDLIFRIDIPANRYDLLCLEGLVRALRIFRGKEPCPQYRALDVESPLRMVVEESTAQVRPFVVCAVLRDLSFSEDSYKSFIDLQDKLHQTIGRKRSLVSIGTHDLDTIEGPFVYKALPPSDIHFVPLNETRDFSAAELMEYYSKDSHLRHYLAIICDKPVYPVIYDRNGVVLSLPPIINGNHSKITLGTKNVFIEITSTDLHKSVIVLDTMVTMFSEYCKKPFTAEKVEVVMPNGQSAFYPELRYREVTARAKDMCRILGLKLEPDNLASLLRRMGLCAKADDDTLIVTAPPTRHDVLHAVDLAEDTAVAYGYGNLPIASPATSTVGQEQPLNKMSDQLRLELAHCAFTEALTFALCSKEDLSTKLLKPDGVENAVHVSNPKTVEFQVTRTTLLPGLLKTVHANRKMPLPLKLFEVSDIVFKDPSTNVQASNRRHLCALHYGKTSGFEIIHGLLDRLMQLLQVDYHLSASQGRCAEVLVNSKCIGKLGVLHPEVIVKFDLQLPCAMLEMDIEPFV